MNSSYSYIGEGGLGGKAEGLKLLHKIAKNTIFTEYSEFIVSIPRTIVISSATFDQFMEQNDLYPFALSEMDDRRITQQFQKASLPPDILRSPGNSYKYQNSSGCQVIQSSGRFS